jgi:hypothetical protein
MAGIDEQVLEHIAGHLRAVDSVEGLAAFTKRMVGQLLRRDEDRPLRDKTLARVHAFFLSPLGQTLTDEVRDFAVEAISIIVELRRQRGAIQMSSEEIDGIYSSLEEETLDPVRGQATEPTRIILVPPPAAESHPGFEALFAAALRYKVGLAISFFQRWNPRVVRRVPTPFLLSTAFGANLDRVIEQKIAPAMLQSRTVRHIGTLYRWAEIDSVSFWQVASEGGHMAAIKKAWELAWDQFRPKRVKRKTAQGETTVLRAGSELRTLREMLSSEKYALPDIRSREIDLFASFLEPDATRDSLEHVWTRLRQLYEQELDRRFYQDKARSGALRDSLLDCFQPFSARTAEFLSLLCYRNFPYLTMAFLLTFTTNHGVNEEARRKTIPFLMWFLDLPGAGEALEADNRWIAEKTVRDDARLREAAEQEQQRRRLAEMNAVVWGAPSRS